MTTDPAFGEDERTRGRENERTKKRRNEKRRENEIHEETHERKGRGRERERFLLVALSPGCRVILPYYYPHLMPAALCRVEE